MSMSPVFEVLPFDQLSLEQLQRIHILRSRVFTVGQQITEQEPDELDFSAIHVFHVAESGAVDAYARVFPAAADGEHAHPWADAWAWSIGRVAVDASARGQGLGGALVAACVDWIREHTNAPQIVISAQLYLADTLYASAGFTQRGDVYPEAGIDHIAMSLNL
ncbi:MAG: GNAT family N-acetyltransferase [Rothia sp. (in: high G+C Gram-positive bacteria)]|uniref:GNAT family N-acetyltransferase n=1 Tax=Rothia sp. (in: high G+C Gram-positive bacteria) TaxID=1885016 RepID=UPI0026DF8B70|nr:GNAT family N-acetyltransferase [Rothia sp. (in: high G+C Gram-positive bacteria)]MDO5750617.1 GNAT family N-acetyltransferase [Rothia sp. (in: high G+C Gram-positive bacteria)]